MPFCLQAESLTMTGDSQMKDPSGTKKELIAEISALKKKIQKLEKSEAKRKLGEAALKESEIKYRSLVECSSDAIFCVDKKGQYQFTNHLFASTFGKSPDYFIGKTFWDIYPKEHADQRYAVTKRVFQTGKSESVEVEVPLPGKTLYFYATANPVKDETGKVIQILTHASDITERKQAEKALRESEENFRRSLDESPLGVRIVTADGETIYANRSILDFYGYKSIKELKTTPVEKRYTKESYAKFQLRREKRKHAVDSPSEYEISIFRKNGEVRHLHVFRKEVLWGSERQYQVVYQDITERKLAEEAMRESEKKYQRIAENMNCIVTETDAQGIIRYISPSDKRILGDKREIVGNSAFNTVHPEDRDRVAAQYMEGIRAKKDSAAVEYRVLHADGHYIWVHSSGRPLFDAAGEYAGMIVTSSVITERKLAEQALRHSEVNYRSVIENIQDVFYRTDAQGILIMASPSFATLLGYDSLDDCLGKPIAEVAYYEPDKRKEFLRALQDKGSVTNYEVVLKRKNGTPVTVETNSHFYLDDMGNIAGIEGIYRDITERKQSEKVLRESEERFRSVVEKSLIGIAIVDDAFRYIYVNEEFCNMAGYMEQEILGKDFTFLLAEESKTLAAERYQRRQQGVGLR